MAKDFAAQLSRIGHKAELLVTRYSTLKEHNARLRQQVLELQATLRAHEALIEKQRIELEHLRISSAADKEQRVVPPGRSLTRAAYG